MIYRDFGRFSSFVLNSHDSFGIINNLNHWLPSGLSAIDKSYTIFTLTYFRKSNYYLRNQ